jgi:hypothetical protein
MGGYRHREVILHSASLPGTAAFGARASLFFRMKLRRSLFQECAHCWSGATRADPACHCLGFYIIAVLFAIFGLPRLFAPDRSIRVQRLYPRTVHGVLLMMGAAGLWIGSRLVGK